MPKKTNMPCGRRQWEIFSLIVQGKTTYEDLRKALNITTEMVTCTAHYLAKKGLIERYKVPGKGKACKLTAFGDEVAEPMRIAQESIKKL